MRVLVLVTEDGKYRRCRNAQSNLRSGLQPYINKRREQPYLFFFLNPHL
jgi:hypothetical protein